jgi:AraC-like DNA-binding protein
MRTPEIPTAKQVGGGGSSIARPIWDYHDHFDAEADRAAFMANAKEWQDARSDPAKPPPPRERRVISRIEQLIPRAIELREMGCPDSYICGHLHIARQTLVQHLGPSKSIHCKLTDAEREEKQATAFELHALGWNMSDIAAEVGVSRQSVRRWFIKEAEAA